jgi:hypothetical protein
MRDIAEDLREGADFEGLCTTYDISGHTLTQRLNHAGYGISGQPLRVEARPSATSPLIVAEGNYVCGGVGGGDYQGLPIDPVPHIRRRKQFLGLDWSTSPATGPLWEWV